jgi:hypothetical protein
MSETRLGAAAGLGRLVRLSMECSRAEFLRTTPTPLDDVVEKIRKLVDR